MVNSVSKDHPVQRLLIFNEGPMGGSLLEKFEELIEDLAESRTWTIRPPELAYTEDNWDELSRIDTPAEWPGVVYEMYSALPPCVLPREIDLQHLEEVETIVNAISDFSRENNLVFRLELDGTYVGSILQGKPNKTLEICLLGEWRRQLGKA